MRIDFTKPLHPSSPPLPLAVLGLLLGLVVLVQGCASSGGPAVTAPPPAGAPKVAPPEPLPESAAPEAQPPEEEEVVLKPGRETARKLSLNPRTMQQWMKRISPGKMHRRLDYLVGSWNATGKIWLAPGTPPGALTGTSEARWILGGRFVEMVFTGKGFGLLFEGRALEGYDNTREEFVGTWADTMGTGIWNLTGQAQSESVRVMRADVSDPLTGGTRGLETVVTRLSEKSYRFEVFDVTGGERSKSLEIEFTRRHPAEGAGEQEHSGDGESK